MSDTMESIKNTDDDTSSVVMVTPAVGSDAGEEVKSESEKKDNNDKPKTESEKNKEAEQINDAEEKKETLIGSIAESKDLYAQVDKNGNRSWTEKYPADLEEAAENEQTRKYAVIVRKKKPKQADSTKPLVIDSIIIQSPHLKKAVAEILDGYPGIVTNVSRLTLSAPFECFVHRWDRFVEVKNDPKHDEVTRQHLELLYKIMNEELGDIIQLREDYLKNRAVTWAHVWTLFPPGCTVYGSMMGKPMAARFYRGYFSETNCGKQYTMQCQYLDWDGKTQGWAVHFFQIPEYLGTTPFWDLRCYPLEYHPHCDAVKDKLISRGRRFMDFRGYYYKAYNGTAVYYPEPDKPARETVQSRIVIDGENYAKNNPNKVLYLTPMRRCLTADSKSTGDADDESGDDRLQQDEPDGRGPLTDEQLILTSPIVRGYALKNKRWMELFIDDVIGVEFNEDAFNSLVLPEDQKELILAFAQSQIKFKNTFDDVISGKGKGIIMLLSGGPGIGKTLTAESVAEEMQVPLYSMSAGDLGVHPDEVEKNLSQILEMVANWNAVLLLDECDVFLEERSANNMERNRIVSIFLRTLEYYQGTLFLTTNRVNNMDPAFQSRIHVSLEYPPLDTAARAAVWRTFLARAVSVGEGARIGGPETHDVTSAEMAALSRLDLNGRQIKNALKMASLLACHRGERLAFRHLRTVLRVEGQLL